jgi:alpha-glucosidase
MRIAFTVTLILCLCALASAQPSTLKSPDGRLAITFNSPQGKLTYEVSFRGKTLIEPSAMALHLQGARPLGADVHIADVEAPAATAEENYTLVTGKTSHVRARYKQMHFDAAAPDGRHFIVEVRAYDDGVAFRYVVPAQPAIREYRLVKEQTEFRIAKDATIWSLELPNYRSMYESEFIKLPISGFSNQGGVTSNVLAGLPMLLEVPGVAWLAITEANMRDTSSMYLVNPSGSWLGHYLQSQLAPNSAEPDLAVVAALPHNSAWRVLMVADDPLRFVESNVISSLNPDPPAGRDWSWVHAGKSAWDWWSGSIGPDGKGAFTTATMKYYVDFAAKSRLEYMLVDAGWSPQNDITKMNGSVDIPELVRYAAAKNVKIWIWLHWAAVDAQMEQAFPLYEKWGVAGVKIDFMSRDDQVMMHWYYRVAETAAAHHLMVDFHGATKPWGMERTWPNVLGFEAVAGMEQSKAGARDNPDHHVTLPFTRMIAGAMDYTPGGFDNVTKAEFIPRMDHPMVQGTRAHQLAMYAVYEAPMQMVSDHPGAYENQPAFDFIKAAPATWDETRALSGAPGEYVTIARRKGDEWFLGSMTNWSPRKVDIPLTFLGGGRYDAEIYADSADAAVAPKHVTISKMSANSSTLLSASMAPGGGFAAHFKLIPPPAQQATPEKLPGAGLAQHPFLYCGEWQDRGHSDQVMQIVRGGKVEWSYAIPGREEYGDCTRLSNGNIVFSRRFSASEITPEKKIVWNYDAPPNTEIHTAYPIGKERVLVMQNGDPAKLLVIEKATNKVVKEMILPTRSPEGIHGQFRHVRVTKAGTFLVAHLDLGKVVEYSPEGSVIWSVPAPSAWGAVRLKNGNTLISGNQHGYVREVNPKGETVWEINRHDLPGYPLYTVQEVDRLANGNTVICNWAGSLPFEQWTGAVQIIEVTPDKKVVWALRDWKTLGPASSIQLLDEKGVPENGDLQR